MVEFKTALDTLLAEDTSEQREPPVPPGDAVSPMAQVVAPRPRFEEMDGNHDGVINRDEVTGLATPTHTQSDKSHPKPTLSFPLLSRHGSSPPISRPTRRRWARRRLLHHPSPPLLSLIALARASPLPRRLQDQPWLCLRDSLHDDGPYPTWKPPSSEPHPHCR